MHAAFSLHVLILLDAQIMFDEKKMMKLLILQFPVPSCYFPSLKYVCKHGQFMFFPLRQAIKLGTHKHRYHYNLYIEPCLMSFNISVI